MLPNIYPKLSKLIYSKFTTHIYYKIATHSYFEIYKTFLFYSKFAKNNNFLICPYLLLSQLCCFLDVQSLCLSAGLSPLFAWFHMS